MASSGFDAYQAFGQGNNALGVVHVARGDHENAIASLREAIDMGWRRSWWRLRGALFDEINKVNPFVQGKLHKRKDYSGFRNRSRKSSH